MNRLDDVSLAWRKLAGRHDVSEGSGRAAECIEL